MSNMPDTASRFYRVLILTQATYIFITAVWPILDIESFMRVTGPKTDIWLVKTVGALLIPVALSLYGHLSARADYRTAVILGGFTAVAFICVNFYYALNGVISDIYLADGAVEFIFLAGWIFVAMTQNRSAHKNK